MNYCTRCESFYQRAGTCNCFAPTRTIEVQPQPETTAVPIRFVPMPYAPTAVPIRFVPMPYAPTIAPVIQYPGPITIIGSGGFTSPAFDATSSLTITNTTGLRS